MLELKNIRIERSGKLLADSISFGAKEGHFLSIIGPNGCGKTTLLHAIAALLKPNGGIVLIDSLDARKLTSKELSKKLGFLPQKSRSVELSVFDMTLLGRKPIFGMTPKKVDFDKVEEILISLGLEAMAHRSCATLSGGELQKALLAKALAQEPKVMLLDEPTNHLDAKNRVETLSLFREKAKEQNIALVAVLHDINDAFRFADSVALLNNGKILYNGAPKELKASHLEELYNISVKIFENDGLRHAVFGV